jgi:hypothetical protein
MIVMSPAVTCVALALVGVDLGYRPTSNGGTDFILHINPATLQAVRPGQSIDIDVARDARDTRPSHFSITPGSEKLPGELASASLLPPAAMPSVDAARVMPAIANSSISSGGVAPAKEPASNPLPSFFNPSKSTVAHVGPLLTAKSPASPANSAESRFGGLAPVRTDGGNSTQPDRPWLGMCLLVIALVASNAYVGWLFWDAQQRYRGLLARSFSFGQAATEA